MILEQLGDPIRDLPRAFNNIIETAISLKRIEVFMARDEIDGSFRNISDSDIAISIKNGWFSWGRSEVSDKKAEIKSKEIEEQNLNTEKSEELEEFQCVLKEIGLEIKKGEMIGVIGKVGSGKSSLIQACLNNLLLLDQEGKVEVNGRIALVNQTSWIQNCSLKDNILFEKPLNDDLYNEVIRVCELKSDLEQLNAGDKTEIGEKGINLSGGQKARVSIARAAYSEADIYLLDDPISALDAHVGQAVMINCFCNFMKGKTRILITHALQYLSFMDRIIHMEDGRISWIGSYEEIKAQPFYGELVGSEENKKQSEESSEKIELIVEEKK